MSYGVGTLVKARGREWVVLPGSTEGLLKLRPLGGAQAWETGILTSLGHVEHVSFETSCVWPTAPAPGPSVESRKRVNRLPATASRYRILNMRVGQLHPCSLTGSV